LSYTCQVSKSFSAPYKTSGKNSPTKHMLNFMGLYSQLQSVIVRNWASQCNKPFTTYDIQAELILP